MDDLAAPVVAALLPVLDGLEEARESLRVLSALARLLPAFAGVDEPRTTVLFFLNNAELRPGGGFLGSFALLTMRDADIQSLETHDVYAMDEPVQHLVTTQPPAPIRRYLGMDVWYARDANWSPDFAVSTREFLERRRSQIALAAAEQRVGPLSPAPVHNVVGLTPTFVSDVLRVIGSVTADGVTYTAENIYDLLQYEVEFGFEDRGIAYEDRKQALVRLVEEVRTRLYDLPLDRWPAVFTAFEGAVAHKQIAFYSEDQPVQELLASFGWAGRVPPPRAGADALMFVDANLAALKSDPVVDRSISYGLRFNNSRQLVATATVRYVHRGAFDWKTTRYRSYVRLYVPKGSQWIATAGSLLDDPLRNPSLLPGPTDVFDDLDYTVFGTFISVEPGETRDLTFTYVLSDDVARSVLENGAYSLRVSKQIGAAPRALTLRLAFDKNLAVADPPERREEWGDGTYAVETTLDDDRMFTVGF